MKIFENEFLIAIERSEITEQINDNYLLKMKDLYKECNVFIQPKEILCNGRKEFRWFIAKGNSLDDFIKNYLNDEVDFIKAKQSKAKEIK
ncbi:TPA: hypothetical protein RTH13_001180 [Campylobacter jejuni]|nr:hypothetical protein [Campylobacter jejuni]HDZ5096287.1 hypothetical protein [Campylobacter jejuni]HDZ5129047.1 hypothetical protein [Campylobacter jejuni]HDZ5130914.1 hypothetical protein [Campylobacter jejuni]